MNDQTIRKIGRTLRVAQFHHLQKMVFPQDYIRVTYTHHVAESDIKNFESIVHYLAQSRHPLSPKEFFHMMEGKEKVKGQSLLMTFDDGLLSSYYAAKNILSKYKIKAAFFIPTQILTLKSDAEKKEFALRNLFYGERLNNDLSPAEYITMGQNEIIDLHKEGHMILPHTHTHCQLKDIQDQVTAEQEIIKPKKILEELLQCEIKAFAFPVGTERVVSSYVFPYIQREYHFCFSTMAGGNTLETNPYFLHRDCLHAHHDLPHVCNVLDGIFDFYYLYKMARLKEAFRNV